MLRVLAAVFLVAPAMASSPKLELHCPAPCQFRQGESIWLELDFSAPLPNDFKVLTNYTDRDMAREEFAVAPQTGWSDPFWAYERLLRVQAGSFQFKEVRPSESAVRVRINLNQWIRFDQPGAYRVSVISPRAGSLFRLKSNEIPVTILPADPAWLHARFVRDRERLSFDEDAIHDLTNLGTEEAAIEMARHVGQDIRFLRLYESGIVRSPFRALAVRAMKRLLADPDFSVTELFLAALANVSADPVADPGAMVHQAQANRTALLHRLSAALSNKRGAARVNSANALVNFGPH